MSFALTVPRPRGCGNRKPGGMYACCASSPAGKPVEYFLHCPPIPHDEKFHRSPKVVDGDLLIWIGKEFYAWPSDYIEEVREQGASRRIPANYPIEKLALGARMRLVHANALFRGLVPEIYDRDDPCLVPLPFPKLVPFCPKDRKEHWEPGEEDFAPCLGRSYQVAPPKYITGALMTTAEEYFRVIGSTRYKVFPVKLPEGYVPRFEPGLFASFPLTHFEYVHDPNDDFCNKRAEKKASESRIPIVVVEE